VQPTRQFTIVEGPLGFHTQGMREAYDIRVFLDPQDELRRRWKVQRDCSLRGYTTDRALDELDREEADAEAFVRPQRRCADLVISFLPGERDDQEQVDVELRFRSGLVLGELASLVAEHDAHVQLRDLGDELLLLIPGAIAADCSQAIQEAIWDRIPFASHLRGDRLGEFTAGTQVRQSESLAVTQLLIVYEMVTARAAISVGAIGGRAASASTPDADDDAGLGRDELHERGNGRAHGADRRADDEPRAGRRAVAQGDLPQPPP
jgi:phosphoribulokinase